MLKRKRCAHDNCLVGPSFNYPTETKALFCGEHKLENMIVANFLVVFLYLRYLYFEH